MIRLRTLALFAGVASLAACDMAPAYVRSVSDYMPPQWPAGAAYPPADTAAAGMSWQALATDARLRSVIAEALAHNQDLAAAVASVASARAQYRVQRSYQLPTFAAGGGASVQRAIGGGNGATAASTVWSADIGVSGFELDLFGRLKSLSRAALEQYLATESGARATRLTVVAETATAYVTLAADRDLLKVAQDQVASSARTVALNRDLHVNGLVSGADVADADTVLAQARSDVEQYTTQVAQDQNALELLVGHPLAATALPASLAQLDPGLSVPSAGLSSAVLLARPDVVEAEHQLKAAHYDIGAARAAFFPTISLTGALGLASTALTGLFSGGASLWSASSSVSVPVLGGTNRGNLAYAQAQRDYDLATYRKIAQTAYRDVADALARRGTMSRQRIAQADLVAASTRSQTIAEARYREGVDSFLTTLVAQRTSYAARQTQTATILADLSNRIALYAAIGADPGL